MDERADGVDADNRTDSIENKPRLGEDSVPVGVPEKDENIEEKREPVFAPEFAREGEELGVDINVVKILVIDIHSKRRKLALQYFYLSRFLPFLLTQLPNPDFPRNRRG